MMGDLKTIQDLNRIVAGVDKLVVMSDRLADKVEHLSETIETIKASQSAAESRLVHLEREHSKTVELLASLAGKTRESPAIITPRHAGLAGIAGIVGSALTYLAQMLVHLF